LAIGLSSVGKKTIKDMKKGDGARGDRSVRKTKQVSVSGKNAFP